MKIIITENKLNRVVLTWLDNEYGNLTKIVKGDKIYYVDQDGLSLFYCYQDLKNKYVFINYDRIWRLLQSIFGLEILKVWLEQTYNLRGVTPKLKNHLEQSFGWNRHIK